MTHFMSLAAILHLISSAGPSHADPFKEAALYLGGIEGLQLSETPKGEIVVTGEVQRQSDLKKLRLFTKDFPQVQNRTSLAPEALAQIERLLIKRLKAIEPRGQIHRRGQNFYLRGSDSDTVLQSLQKIHPHIEFEQSGIRGAPGIKATVFLEIALIEVKRTALSRLGTRLGSPIGISSQFGLQFIQSKGAQAGIVSDPIRGFLDLALQKGEARIHAKQSLVSQNGRRGTFMAGGEFPIKVVSGIVAKVEFKRFGLILTFTPHLESQSKVFLDIDSEISDIDMGSMVDGIPIILKKELRTQISASLDQMMAIAGLVENRQSSFTDRIPGLSAIPILGRLFESEDFKRHRSEAYLFITPRVMSSPWLPSPEL